MKSIPVTPEQFGLFRIIFGLYLTVHFYELIPYGSELFSQQGMIPDPNMSPTWSHWPVKLDLNNTQITQFLILMTILSLMLSVGLARNLTSLLLWFGWAYLFNRNPFISNPGLPYVGWLLLACALIPSGERFCIWSNTWSNTNQKWWMPSIIYWSAWFLMALGYTISGVHKLQCPSWIDGSALRHVFSGVLARDNYLVSGLLNSNPIFLRLLTWSSLILEISFLPLGLFDRLQKWSWLAFMGLHLGILATVNFTDLTLGVLMIHLFTFNSCWLQEFPFNLFYHRIKID